MRKTNVEHYAAAVIFMGKRLLLIRELGKDDFPNVGFHFPGGRAKNEEQLIPALKEALRTKYGATVKVVDSMPPMAHMKEGRKIILHGFVCDLLSNFAFPKDHFEYVYADFDRIPSLYLDPLDRKLAERVVRFYPLYAHKSRYLKLSEKENGEANFYLDSLFYFRSAIPDREISDFSLLIHSDSTIGQIRSAYAWLLNLYGLDLNQYLDVVDYKKAHSKK